MWEANVGKGQNFGLTTPKPNCLSKKLACCCQKVWTAILGLYCASGIGPLHKVNGVAKERRPIERGGVEGHNLEIPPFRTLECR